MKRKFNNFDINLEELNYISRNKDAILLDVRSPQEYNEGHLINAINIPFYELNTKLKKITDNKDKIIIVYCLSGKRSKKSVKILNEYGYNNVYNLKGGIGVN